MIGSIVEIINRTANSTQALTPHQELLDQLAPSTAPHRPDLERYRAIGSECIVLVPPASREASYKLAPRGVPRKLLAVIGHNTYSVYLGNRKVVQTCFIKLFENP